ncbi:hypothetical protein DRW48_05555 [Paracoccus suum]|uniref:Uncharacterized protein n=1 Tax=Paracoccus suum TaxID=2259340 RepID=A0A344PIL3_9RHOB|nr:hypothetical protein [Paracoccus suum]AXC49218.1 hypothetical protein DRW48_05555 [Paracoccus suum]
MSILDVLPPRLTAPAAIPPMIVAARIDVAMVDQAADGKDITHNREEMPDSLSDVAQLLRQGFLGPAGAATLKFSEPERGHFLISYDGGPRHPDLIVLLLRFVHTLNQTPPRSWEMVLNAFDGDEAAAREVYAGGDFVDAIAAVRVTAEGAGGKPRAFDPLRPAGPTNGLDQLRGDTVRAKKVAVPDVETEDAWLSFSVLGVFNPPEIADEDTDPEIFASGSDLVIDRITAEPSWVVAFLTLLAPGGFEAQIEE